ncbi:MAG: NupC/NupG family nucleoside CNT transporter [Oligoflexales bacterium]|nr:NupC/NupG family nucleoside CNT transporter [Oligoflexales bacterium]
MQRLMSVIGLLTMLLFAWLLSNNKKKMDLRVIIGGLAMQFFLAIVILKTDLGIAFFTKANQAIRAFVAMSDRGAEFTFGSTFRTHFFAFSVLPTIVFVSSVSYLLFYWGIMQKIVKWMAYVMQKVMNVSGSESLVTAANIICGQTEGALFIQPYLKTMTMSEICCMITSGMACVSGGVLAAYVGMGISAGHLLAASLMSAPAAMLISKIMYPEVEPSVTKGQIKIELKIKEVNAFEAACKGATEGLFLALNVGAMLVAFISLIALANLLLGKFLSNFGYQLSIEQIFGWFFQPVAFLLGISWDESFIVGRLFGEKTVINEFLAYVHLAEHVRAGTLSPRAINIATYALCGFANFTSIAIQIGGIGALEPSRKSDFAKIGFKAMIGGTLSSFMTASIAGILM